MDTHAPEYVSYKKMCVFGTKGTGKTSLIRSLEKGSATLNEAHTEKSKLFIIL